MLLLYLIASAVPALGQHHPGHSFVTPFESSSLKYWKQTPYVTVDRSAIHLTSTQKTGSVWNVVRSLMTSWEVDVEVNLKVDMSEELPFRGEGLAFWYVEKPGIMGPVYGSADFWKGLGVFFTAVRDKSSGASQLMILGANNDGTQQYGGVSNVPHDASVLIGSCTRPLVQGGNVVVSVRYASNRLSVNVKGPFSQGQSTPCFTADINLGVDKFFGFSAHASTRGDQHNLLNMQTKDLEQHKPTEQELEQVRASYEESMEKQQLANHHHPKSIEHFRAEVINILHQVQDTQAFEEEEIELLIRSSMNHTDKLSAVHLALLILRKQQREILEQLHNSERDKNGANPGGPAQLADLTHRLDQRLDHLEQMLQRRRSQQRGTTTSLSWWWVLGGGVASALSVLVLGYYRKWKQEKDAASKRFL